MADEAAGAGVAADPEHYGVSVAILLGDLALAWCDDLFLARALPLGAAGRAPAGLAGDAHRGAGRGSCWT
ncbi:MAG: hypothetical protein U0R72_12830 [Nakamurella multipartita]